MKTIIFFMLMLIACKTNAQIFVTLEPEFFRPGVLCQHSFKSFGVYSHAWYGKMNFPGEVSLTNYKFGGGFTYEMQKNDNTRLYFGINKSLYYARKLEPILFGVPDKVNLSRIYPISCEVGFTVKVNRLTLLAMTDFLNWETMVGVNYQLIKHSKHKKH